MESLSAFEKTLLWLIVSLFLTMIASQAYIAGEHHQQLEDKQKIQLSYRTGFTEAVQVFSSLPNGGDKKTAHVKVYVDEGTNS